MKSIKIKRTTYKAQELSAKDLQTQQQAIQYFVERMDIEMIDAFLDEDKTYQDFEKYLFISKLQTIFETFKSFGDTLLLPILGRCGFCDKTKAGFTFYGNNSKNYITMIFDVENHKINDLYECTDFVNLQNDVQLNEQIFIDEQNNSFAPF